MISKDIIDTIDALKYSLQVDVVIDPDGFRPNVGIILCNDTGQVFWAKRINQQAWQFPQGGIRKDESHLDAMYRELHEETGLKPHHVEVIGVTKRWLRYRLPRRLIRRHSTPVCIGQKQRWYALRLVGNESKVCLDGSETPEFDGWKWVDYWYPSDKVVSFKRKVYRRALKETQAFDQTTKNSSSPGRLIGNVTACYSTKDCSTGKQIS